MRISSKIIIAANGTMAAELTAHSLDTRSPWNISWGDLVQGGGKICESDPIGNSPFTWSYKGRAVGWNGAGLACRGTSIKTGFDGSANSIMKNTPRPPWIPGSKLETALSSFSEEPRELNWNREGLAAVIHTMLTQRSPFLGSPDCCPFGNTLASGLDTER